MAPLYFYGYRIGANYFWWCNFGYNKPITMRGFASWSVSVIISGLFLNDYQNHRASIIVG